MSMRDTDMASLMPHATFHGLFSAASDSAVCEKIMGYGSALTQNLLQLD